MADKRKTLADLLKDADKPKKEKTLGDFIDFSGTSCSDVESIKDINDKYNYQDERPNGEGDSELVACGQDDKNGYNELRYIYRTKLSQYIPFKFTKKQALVALCETCKELDNPRSRRRFYTKLSIKLGTNIH